MWFFPFVFKNAMMILTEKYACFKGRADRWEYWCWIVFKILLAFAILLGCIIGGFVIGLFFGESELKIFTVFIYLLLTLIELGLMLPGLAVTVRRLHDTNRSGWWFLTCLIPYVGGLILLILLALRGNYVSNKYGEPVMR